MAYGTPHSQTLGPPAPGSLSAAEHTPLIACKFFRVFKTNDADNPLHLGLRPLLAIDVWEHAYRLDVEHQRRQ